MPKLVLPKFYEEGRPIKAPLPVDGPCPLGSLVILKNSARIYVKSRDSYITVIMPYNGYDLQYTVPADLYNCVGWDRKAEAYQVTIWDSKSSCTFTIPALARPNT